MKKLITAFVLATFLVTFTAVGLAKNTTPPLTCTTEYFFVGGDLIFDDDGRLLAWEGPISGDIEGVIQWWIALPAKKNGQASHPLERWMILNGKGEVLLVGDEKGTSTICHEKNTTWRANGIVIDAPNGEFSDYIGSQTHNSGDATWAAPGVPEHGTGKLRIAGSNSKAAPGKHGKSATLWGNIKAGK